MRALLELLKARSFSDWVAALALFVSVATAGLGYWLTIRDDHRTLLVPYLVQVKEAEGRLGKGPALMFIFSLANLGNRPVLLNGLRASFGRSVNGTPIVDCEINADQQWTGLPWAKQYLGAEVVHASPVTINPQNITPLVIDFEPAPVMGESDQPMAICIGFDLIESTGASRTVRVPVASLSRKDATYRVTKGFSVGGVILID